jgi:hypothetical protein
MVEEVAMVLLMRATLYAVGNSEVAYHVNSRLILSAV